MTNSNEVQFFQNSDMTVMTIGQSSNPTDNEFYLLSGDLDECNKYSDLLEYLKEEPFEDANHPEISPYFDNSKCIITSEDLGFESGIYGKMVKLSDTSGNIEKYFLEIVSDEITETYAFDEIDELQSVATERIYELCN